MYGSARLLIGTAVISRTPCAPSAANRPRSSTALITVPSIPMLSASTRSILLGPVPAEHVPATDHHRDLHPGRTQGDHLGRQVRQPVTTEPELVGSGNCLPGQLEHEPAVHAAPIDQKAVMVAGARSARDSARITAAGPWRRTDNRVSRSITLPVTPAGKSGVGQPVLTARSSLCTTNSIVRVSSMSSRV